MRKLELVMETEMSVGRARQLQEEKREAMDRCEEKNVLSTGAAESMQHRLLNSLVGSRVVATPLDQIMPQSTRAFHGDGRLHIRRSASPASPVPTLSSVGKSWETASRSEHNPTQPSSPCCRADADELTLASPADDCACVSQTDAWQPSVFTSNRSPSEARRGSYPESLIIPLYSLIGARELPDAVDFGPETNLCPHRELSTLFSARLSIFDEPEPYEDDFPIRQQPSPTTRIAGAKRNSTLPLRDTPFPAMNNASNETLDSFVSAASHTLLYSSTASMYAEPSLSRTSSAQAGQPKMVTIQRQSRVPRGRRAWSLQLDKPLPPVIDSEHSRSNYLAENAPEPVYIMQRAEPEGRYSYTGPREEKHRSMSTHGFRSFQSTSFTPLPPIEDNGAEHIPLPKTAVVDYMSAPTETEYKFNSKDSCIKTFVSTDTRHAVFLSPNSFQVFSIPVQGQKFQPKPKCVYRLGDWEGSRWEGLKRGKSHRQYRSAAVSVRYLVTITKERVR